jgi:hypothetical protein
MMTKSPFLRAFRWLVLPAAAVGVGLYVSPTRANAPAGRYVINAGAVTDTKTGLLWQQQAPAQSYTFADAAAYCSGLQLAGYTNGWRVPNVRELLSLIDDTRWAPAIDTAAFPETPSKYFWTSTTYASASSYAWSVIFTSGETSDVPKTLPEQVRCVRF